MFGLRGPRAQGPEPSSYTGNSGHRRSEPEGNESCSNSTEERGDGAGHLVLYEQVRGTRRILKGTGSLFFSMPACMAVMELEQCSVGSPPRYDSGYESVEREVSEPPGVLDERGEFVFHGSMAFVTYSRSRVEDPEDFHRYLRESMEPHLPRVGGLEGDKGTVEVFGSKELHEDGVPHYHVMLRFEPRVHWRKARQNFSVWIDVDGNREVDTCSIFIRKKPEREPAETFLKSVQSYIAKEGNVFGTWIGPRETAARRKEKYYDQLIAAETRQEAELIYKEHFKREWCLHNNNVDAFLRTKKSAPAEKHQPDFEVLPWRVPAKMKQWRERSFGPGRRGRPVPLVIIGESRCGKTEWAMSWGRPAKMSTSWNVDELTKPGITHVVLNDIDTKKFPNKRDLAGCQRYMTVTGKWRPEQTIELGVPVIWTCNQDNSVMHDEELGKYLKQTGAVIVNLGKRKLYVDTP